MYSSPSTRPEDSGERWPPVWAMALAIAVVACSEDLQPCECDDAGSCDGGGDADADADADSDSDSDADSDGDTGSEVDCSGEGVWLDVSSGLCWEDPPPGDWVGYGEAVEHCSALATGGYDDWRVPNIDELRSLIRGCPGTELGGECMVTDGYGPWAMSSPCYGCDPLAGPGAGGCYWDEALAGVCSRYWSSSKYVEGELWEWLADFRDASLDPACYKNVDDYIRCVRLDLPSE